MTRTSLGSYAMYTITVLYWIAFVIVILNAGLKLWNQFKHEIVSPLFAEIIIFMACIAWFCFYYWWS